MKLIDFKEFAPGTVLKVLAFAGRLLFLLAVLPRLLEGQLAEYAFLATIALLGARLVAMGAEDQLPLEVRGDRSRASRFLRAYAALQIFVLFAGLLLLVSGTAATAVLFLALAYLSQQVLSGVIRSIRPLGFEILANLHWLLFPPLCLFAGVRTAVGIVGLMAICILVSQVFVLRFCSLRLAMPQRPLVDLVAMTSCMTLGWQKCLSGFATLANMRSLILWPKMISNVQTADNLAFALLCAEALWQFGMVVVNRKYASFCANEFSGRERLRETMETITWLVGGFLLVAACMFFGQSALHIVADLPWQLIAIATGMFGLAAGFLLLRFYTWSTHTFSWKLAAFDVLLFVTVGIIVKFADPANWAAATFIAFGAHFVAALVVTVAAPLRPVSDCWRHNESKITT